MTVKNLFIFSSVVALAFGLPLLFAPQAIIDMYAIDKSALSGIDVHVSRSFGGLLTAFSIAGFMSYNAEPSYGRRGLLIITVVNAGISTILNILAIMNGVQNSLAWLTVVAVAVIAVWAGLLLSKEKVADLK
jgi:hypothetical protein